jgi:hypothetical protein
VTPGFIRELREQSGENLSLSQWLKYVAKSKQNSILKNPMRFSRRCFSLWLTLLPQAYNDKI